MLGLVAGGSPSSVAASGRLTQIVRPRERSPTSVRHQPSRPSSFVEAISQLDSRWFWVAFYGAILSGFTFHILKANQWRMRYILVPLFLGLGAVLLGVCWALLAGDPLKPVLLLESNFGVPWRSFVNLGYGILLVCGYALLINCALIGVGRMILTTTRKIVAKQRA